MLVSVGAALFTLVGGIPGSDPTRIAAQVVTGIGFLGGGAILREGATVRGLTTAASLWVTAAIGVSVGLHWWFAATATTVLALIVLWLLRHIEHDVMPQRRKLEIVLLLEPDGHLDQVEREARALLPRSRVLKVSYNAEGQTLMLTATPEDAGGLADIGEQLRALSGVHGVEVSR
jgi:putative Mg2+ transporter-C (MgtC) family protein